MILRKCSDIIVIVSLTVPLLALELGCNSGGGGGGPQGPTITSVTATCSPSQVLVGQTSQCTASVQGTGNFNPAVTWSVQGGSTNGTISQNGLYTAPDPAPNPASVNVVATSQADSTKSGSATVSLSFPAPTLTAISPNAVLAGSTDTPVTLTGTGFIKESTISLNGTSLPTTFGSSTQLSATIPAAQLAVGVVDMVTVENPSPGGGTSSPLNFTIDNPVPVVTSISPPSTAAGGSGNTLTINGSNFIPSSTATFNGAPHPATFVGSSQITMALTATDEAKPGAYDVVVTNPPPGGGSSQPVLFSVYFPPSSSGSTAVLVETIPVPAGSSATIRTRSLVPASAQTTMKTVDVAYVPMPSVGQVAALNLDAAPTTGSNQITGAVVATIAMPTGYTPNFTAADAADNVVLVGSYSSNVIVEISIPPLDPTHPKVMGSYSLDAGSGTQFSGGKCIVCGLVVDDRPNRHYAIASTSNGYLIFNPLNGTSAVEGSFNVPPSENFAYDPILQSVMNPNYQCFLFCGGGSLQVLDLKTMGVINSITDFVGSAPDSAAADPQTHLAAVPDEFNSTVYLLNFTGTSLGPVAAWSLNRGRTTNALLQSRDSAQMLPERASPNAAGGSTLGFASATGRTGDKATGAALAKPPIYSRATLRAEREAWFMHGRQSPDNLPPAAHLLRAFRQRESVPFVDWEKIRSAPGPIAATALATNDLWTELGPRPLDTSGSALVESSPDPDGDSDSGSFPYQDDGFVSGRATSIAVDLVKDPSGNTVYVGTAYGGVWKSTNGLGTGKSSCPVNAQGVPPDFCPLNDSLPSLAVGAIALDSSTTPTTIYVGTGEPNNSGDSYYGVGILKSTDDGRTWTRSESADGGQHPFLGLAFSKILVDQTFPNVLLAATTSACCTAGLNLQPTPGVYRSTDGGLTWTLAKLFVDFSGTAHSVTDLILEPVSQVYYAAINTSGFFNFGLYKSLDHGETWIALPSSPQTFSRASLATRGGTLWALVSDTSPLALGGPPALEQTTDGGQTWTSLSLPTWNWTYEPEQTDSGPFNVFCEPGSCQGFYDQFIAGPPSATSLVVGGLDVWITTATNPQLSDWTNTTNANANKAGVVHTDQHAIAVVDAMHWYIGNDGGVWATQDGGGNWTNVSVQLGTIQFTGISPDQTSPGAYLGGAQDNGSSRTGILNASTSVPPGSLPWARVLGGDGGYTATNVNQYFVEQSHVSLYRFDNRAMDLRNDPIPVALGDCSTLTAQGLLCKPITGGSAFYVPYELVPSNPSQIVLGTSEVWTGPSAPASPGEGWQPISGDLTLGGPLLCGGGDINAVAVAPASPNTIYAGTSAGRVWQGTLVNNLWVWLNVTPITLIGLSSCRSLGAVAVHPSNSNTVYIGVQGFGNGGSGNSRGEHVFKSTDGGNTWVDITGNLPDAPVNSILIDPNAPQNIYVATDVGVFVASDGGVFNEFWQQLGAGLPNTTVMQLAITPSKLGPPMIIAATHGRGAWSIPALPGTPDFSIDLMPAGQAVNPGDVATLTAVTSGLNGDSATITLTCMSPSTGCGVSPATVIPGSSATITVAASALVSGPNTVSITATDGTNTHTQTATVKVQDFSLTVTPASGSVPAGQSAVFDVGLLSGTGYDNPVSLNCSVSPPTINIGCLFAPLSINSANPVAQLTVFAGTMVGSFTITVTGTNGNLSHTATLNLTVNPPPTPTSLTVPSSSFQVGPGVTTCQQLGDWTMVAVELNSHALMVGQEFADCIAVAQLPASPVIDATGHPVAPPPPTALRFGEVPKDPDANIWNNGGDPHGIAVFTSVVDGKAYGFVVEGSPGPFDPNGSPGGSPAWVARISLSDFLAATANTSTGEVDPATMAKLITFIGTK